MSQSHFFKASSVPLTDGETESIVHLARTGTHDNRRFTWTSEKFKEAVKNFKAGAYRLFKDDEPVLPVNFGHNHEGEAAGWIKDVFFDEATQSLKARVEWTPTGVQAIREKRYLFMSAVWYINYEDSETGSKYGLVLAGAGLVDDPAVKELDVLTAKKQKEKKQMAAFIQAVVEDMTVEDVIAWLANASLDDKMKVIEAAGGVMRENEMEMESEETPKEAEVKEEDKKEMHASSSKIKALESTVSKLQSQLQTAQRASDFSQLVADGKAVESQREAFMKGDMVAFAKASIGEFNMAAKGFESKRFHASASLKLSDDDRDAAKLSGVPVEEYMRLHKLSN